LEEGLSSSNYYVRLRCKILLASDQGERCLTAARRLGCSDVTVRSVINAFDQEDLALLNKTNGTYGN
jgi:hypothetical protein